MKKYCIFALLITAILSFSSCREKELNTPYTLIISCYEILDNLDSPDFAIKSDKRDIVPEDGVVLKSESKCGEGENVFSVVSDELRKNKLHFDATDGYFLAIANLYAGDCGVYSGWMMFMNDELAQLGASDTVVNPGDRIEFRYIVDYNSLFQ